MRLAAITLAVATVLVAGGCNRIGGGAEAGKAASLDFARGLATAIADRAASASCGWIVDLRGNSGGNIRLRGFDGNRIAQTFDGIESYDQPRTVRIGVVWRP